MKNLYLVDAYALIYKMYYAFITRPMMSPDGVNTSAIFGFTKYIRDIIRKEKPDYLGVAFDSKGPTFRHEMYDQYKANRQAAPEDIHIAVPYIKEILEALCIPILEKQGYEADDIIGTLSCKAADAGFDVYMVTPDKDFGQLIGSHVKIYKQKSKGEGIEIIGCERINEVYGIDDPKLIADILAIWGDASDNIPGVPGIGEKGAVKLVCEFGTVENILANIDKVAGKQREKIEAAKDQLIMSKELATICRDVPVDFNPEELEMCKPDMPRLREIFHKLGFGMFLRELDADRFLPDLPENGINKNTEAGPAHEENLFSPPDIPASTSRKKHPDSQGNLFGNSEDTGLVMSSVASQADLFADAGFGNIDTVEHTYHCVLDAEELRKMVEILAGSEEFTFDAETSGFDPFSDRIVGLAFAVKPHEAWYVPFDSNVQDEYVEILKPVFENEKISKIGQNIKFDIMVLRTMLGIEVRGFKYDTMILHYLLDPESRHGMGYLARTFLGYTPIEIESLIGKGVKQITMDMVSVERCTVYSAEDADITLQLKNVLWPRIVAENLDQLYRTIEEPMIDVLAEIELTGVRVDCDALREYGRQLAGQIESLESQIREVTGEPNMNVNSARQLGDVLFGKMKIDPKPKMTKTKQYRTDEEYLQSLADNNPIVEVILEYRGLRKLLTTYIDALPQLVNPVTGRLHTSYNQAVASTGRLSSSNPNLQNIPIRDEQGREIRRSFVSSGVDYLLLSVDYSQVELRLMAHLSRDRGLIEAFQNGEDIHAATASRIFGVPLPEVTPEHRRRAKTANFGIIYGISAFGLSQRLNIPRGEAKDIIDGYFRSYPGVKNYMDGVIEKARDEGYVSTIFGRKRYLRDIRSGNATVRGLAERNAINAPIQGSAADIMKMAMIAVHREFADRNLESKVILQVHDELVIDMYIPEKDIVTDIVVRSMEKAANLSVDLTVDYGIGKNWLEAH